MPFKKRWRELSEDNCSMEGGWNAFESGGSLPTKPPACRRANGDS